ncbi:hypothetical protein [Veronia nyctiphanis]|nr:hypothetical protein [Veronia nyctiphanis]
MAGIIAQIVSQFSTDNPDLSEVNRGLMITEQKFAVFDFDLD